MVLLFGNLKCLVWLKQFKQRHDTQDNNIQDNDTQHDGLHCDFKVKSQLALWLSAISIKCHYAESGILIAMLDTDIPSFIMLCAVLLNVIMLNVIMLNVIMLNIIMHAECHYAECRYTE